MSVGDALLRQCARPTGWLGRLNLWSMNRRHSKVTEWGLSDVPIREGDTILDIGCGGGGTIRRLGAIASRGKIYGVDYSEDAVAASRRANQQLIAAGRAEIQLASVSKLPFREEVFDLATAVETHYYWPSLSDDLREVRRVLKVGGALILIAAAYKGGKYDRLLRRLEEVERRGVMQYAHLTADEHSALLSAAGYAPVQVIEQYERGWLCAIGRKP